MKRIKQVLEGVYENPELRKSIVPLFISNAGLGKSSIVGQFAKDKGVKLVELITSQISPMEVSGIAMPEEATKKMTYYNFDSLDGLKDGDILFFDELLNGNPNVLNACLTLLEQRRMVSGKPLPDILICAAANEQGMAPLTPQIKERFVWYDIKFDKEMWKTYMYEKFGITQHIFDQLAHLVEKESFTGRNFMTPRSITKAINMMICGVPTPYQKDLDYILAELIQNNTEEIIKVGSKDFLPNETMTWLNIAKLKRGYEIT